MTDLTQQEGRFFYPTHWPDDARSAFRPTAGEHDSHDLSPEFVALMDTRDRYLEDYLNSLTGDHPPFDFPGPLVVSATDLWCPVNTVTVSKFVCTQAVVSSAIVQVGIYKNALSVGTINIPASRQVYVATIAPCTLIGGSDYMTARILSPGTGGSGLLLTPG